MSRSLPDSPNDKTAANAARLYGFTIAQGKATKTGVDANGNPVYTIDAYNMADPQEQIHLTNVTPDRVAEGVIVEQPNTVAPCEGRRNAWMPGDGWLWTVYRERIKWKDC